MLNLFQCLLPLRTGVDIGTRVCVRIRDNDKDLAHSNMVHTILRF